VVAAARTGYWLATGDLARATQWAERTAFDPQTWIAHHTNGLLMQVRVCVARRRYAEAVELLERFVAQLDRTENRWIIVEFLAVYLVALHHAGKDAQARSIAARLFSMTEPEGWLRVYLDVGAPMERVLKAFLDAPAGESPDAPPLPRIYISSLLAAFDQEKQGVHAPTLAAFAPQAPPPPEGVAPAVSPLIEPLTWREQEVLRHLAVGSSNQEIAADLSISLATVKKHVSNLLGKLGARSRTQAVARARDAALL
jgi:LuxR family maltose regulon positive regulatory protein